MLSAHTFSMIFVLPAILLGEGKLLGWWSLFAGSKHNTRKSQT